MLKILAVDTATEACSAALLMGEQVFSRFEEAPRDHTRKILPMVQSLLDEAGITLEDLDAIAFGRGPGSFTGVRIGIGVAQGLALGADKPMIGISTLAAMAQGAQRRDGATRVLAAIDARMNEVYVGQYEMRDGLMVLTGEERVIAPQVLAAEATLPGSWHSIGTGFTTYAEVLTLAEQQVVASGAQLPMAEDMLPLAKAAWEAGDAVPVEAATPVYLRDKVTWKKLPGRE
ncbi:tRNA threonylcarbamoyladenosine biosynthesis protein TsaB [Aeromonas sp. RU39B]|nr:tRNA threonylcarbamoyladenosine biosynthesis protein TsaB [Aeromonas sp. RU39B]